MLASLVALLVLGCSTRTFIEYDAGARDGGGMDAAGGGADAGPRDAGRPPPVDAQLDPDAACASETSQAVVERLPVDILWVVDNSTSMQPAIEQVQAGLNAFAALIGSRDLDYRVIMLSLRGRGIVSVAGSNRYAVCIPQPLAGDASCGDGPNFFQVSVDVRSTQPIEQLLGTLAQTAGYTMTDERGSAPWRDLLRPEATKTIVFVTDDNARTCARPGGTGCQATDPPLTETGLEDFPGGGNPFNSLTLGPGIRTATYGALFEGYTFNAIYGWGSETDPAVTCTYAGGARPPSSGPTYTTLVQRTGGVRAQICDGPAAWGPFFDAVASAVERTSRVDCAITIPEVPSGMFFDSTRVNVFVSEDGVSSRVGRVPSMSACDPTRGGWYYDDPAAPMQVVLCPASCARVQPAPGITRDVEVQFGCQSIPI
ncbi:MAG: hypothetical protein K8H88_10280 [Sandaracinaceae bacterium]|nr:hypothetical protein [Sandaracinaceae bacterium]